jgi:small subunit ribosomal protein S20
MANHASAQKRNRQRIVRSERNRAVLSSVRTAVKKARSAIDSGDGSLAKEKVAEAARALAKAAQKGVVHAKSASRTASRIESQLHKLTAR